jgi:UDP-N-acetylmuramyl pentapeptide synthase
MKKILANSLKNLSKKILEKYQPMMIGISGNVGKTGTRKALVGFLEQLATVRTNIDNYNTELGVPLSIIGARSGGKNPFSWAKILQQGGQVLSRGEYEDIFVMEIGIDHPGDMEFFVNNYLEFDVVVLTYSGDMPVHQEFFEKEKDVLKEETDILKALKEDGLLIVNGDDQKLKNFYRKGKNVITFGFDSDNDVVCSEFKNTLEIDESPERWDTYYSSIIPKVKFKVSYKGSSVPFKVDYIFGQHQVYMILPVIALGLSEGLNLLDISQKINIFTPVYGRMRFMEGLKDSLLIDDTYNAAPSAVKAGLESLSGIAIPDIRKIAVLGDMKELGENSAKIHREIGKVALANVDILVGVGEEMRNAVNVFVKKNKDKNKQAYHFVDREEASAWLEEEVGGNDLVFVKGSQSMRMEKVVQALMLNKKLADQLLVRQSEDWLKKN